MQHHRLGASASARWTRCPGSVKAIEGYPDETSEFAEEGTLAHAVGEEALLTLVNNNKKNITDEMRKHGKEYAEYIGSVAGSFVENIKIETQVYFNSVAEGAFGTCDASVLAGSHLHIFDYKYGKGVDVDAKKNTQMLLYAIGYLDTFPKEVKKVVYITLHIIQPRRGGMKKWTISRGALNKYKVELKKRADDAQKKNAPRIAGDTQCRFCKASDNCPALYNSVVDNMMEMLDEKKDNKEAVVGLSDAQRSFVIDNRLRIEKLIREVIDNTIARALVGIELIGYKLVRGKSNRKWAEGAEEKLCSKYGDAIIERKLLTPAVATKKFSDIDESLIEKPEGKITIVANNDKRPEVVVEKLENLEIIKENHK